MTKHEYRLRMIAGFLAYQIYMVIPDGWLPIRVALLFVEWAGFYAYNDGWENFKERVNRG